MSIEEYYSWQERFENWVQANNVRSWECIETKYVRPRNNVGVIKNISEFTEKEREMYKAEKNDDQFTSTSCERRHFHITST